MAFGTHYPYQKSIVFNSLHKQLVKAMWVCITIKLLHLLLNLNIMFATLTKTTEMFNISG